MKMNDISNRAGQYVAQGEGDRAFVPKPLPPDPALEVSSGLLGLLSRADRELGRLDGIAQVVPDPDFFVAMYVRREAVLSSQIEGTQSTLEDLLAAEIAEDALELPDDVDEIVNYVAAMNHGLRRLADLPLSLRLIREIHAELLRSGRGARRAPGKFRRTQNWIGPEGAPRKNATFVPPPVPEMTGALGQLEQFLHADDDLPPLIKIGFAHAQFETIHPFMDGNGRVGRLLITFYLVQTGLLQRPLLYLSHYFKLNRAEYYDRLMAIRLQGDWEGWTRFFLEGVAQTASEATATALAIFEQRERHRSEVLGARLGQHALPLLALLYERPLVSVRLAQDRLQVSFGTANTLIGRFEDLGLLREITGQQRGRVFRYEPYLDLLRDPDPKLSPEEPATTRPT